MDLTTAFTTAMSRFPSGVTIVTTRDADGRTWGFTATSFASLSLDPPLVLVCLAKTSSSHGAFLRATEWLIHVLGTEDAELCLAFARRGGDKFAGIRLESAEDELPRLPGAITVLRCTVEAMPDGGDHTILIGRVEEVSLEQGEPLIYFARRFHELSQLPDKVDQGRVEWLQLNSESLTAPSFGLL